MGNETLLWWLVPGFLALVVFVLLREFWTWYWKQSEQVRLLRSIDRHLEQLVAQRAPGAFPAPAAPAGPDPRGWRDRVLDRMAGVP